MVPVKTPTLYPALSTVTVSGVPWNPVVMTSVGVRGIPAATVAVQVSTR